MRETRERCRKISMIDNRVMRFAGKIMAMAIILSIIFLFVGIGLLIFVHVCIVGRALRRRFGNGSLVMMETRSSNDSITTGNTGMSKDDLEKLPSFDYVIKDTATSPVDCAVCLESFQAGEKCRLLPICKHGFHAECVDAWLLQAPFCPMCRTSADSSKGSGENTSHDMRRESQATERSGHLSDVRIEVGESQGVLEVEGSGQLSGETRDNNDFMIRNQAMGTNESVW